MFSTAKNNRCFSLVIPADEKYVPLVRRYVVEILSAYKYKGDFLYKVEVVIDELCCAVSQEVKQTTAVWLDIKFEINDKGFSFNLLKRKGFESKVSAANEVSIWQEHGIDSPGFSLAERYLNSVRMELKNGRISNVSVACSGKVN